ncbi:LPXTG cell wall anchor domain-containing protein [Streptococcus sp. 10F2]
MVNQKPGVSSQQAAGLASSKDFVNTRAMEGQGQESLPNTGTDSSYMLSAAGVTLLATLGSVKGRRKKSE